MASDEFNLDSEHARLLRHLSDATSLSAGVVVTEALLLWASARGVYVDGSDRILRATARHQDQSLQALSSLPGSILENLLPSPKFARDGNPHSNRGAQDWSQPHEWLPYVFEFLGHCSPHDLQNARLVCSVWASKVLATCAKMVSLDKLTAQEAIRITERGLLGRCSSLECLAIQHSTECTSYAAKWAVDPGILKSLLDSAAGLEHLRHVSLSTPLNFGLHPCQVASLARLPQLQTLSLHYAPIQTLDGLGRSIPGPSKYSPMKRGRAIPVLSSLPQLTRLDIRQEYNGPLVFDPTTLPPNLTRLRLEGLGFESFNLRSFRCLERLTHLEINLCDLRTFGLRYAANLKRLTLLEAYDQWVIREGDLDDVLQLRKLEHLDVRGHLIPIGWLERVATYLPGLTTLWVGQYSDQTNDALQPLSNLTSLTSLKIGDRIGSTRNRSSSPHSLWHLRMLLGLRELGVFGQDSTPSLSHLQWLTGIRSLDLAGTRLEASAAEQLPPQLEHLGLSWSLTSLSNMHCGNGISKATAVLEKVVDRCPGLTSIDLSFNRNLSLSGLAVLAKLSRLQHVYLHNLDREHLWYDGAFDDRIAKVHHALTCGLLQAMPVLRKVAADPSSMSPRMTLDRKYRGKLHTSVADIVDIMDKGVAGRDGSSWVPTPAAPLSKYRPHA